MRIGYLLSDVPCQLNTYESYLKCHAGYEYLKPIMNFYEKFVAKNEDITFVPFEILTPENTSDFSTNNSLLGALANGAIDVYSNDLVLTPKRLEFLSFTTPDSLEKICFYMKKPEASHITEHPLYFLTPFSIYIWFLLVSALIAIQILSQIIFRRFHQNYILALKGISCVLVLAEGLIATCYLAALREVLVESGSFKPPFRNIYENGSRPL